MVDCHFKPQSGDPWKPGRFKAFVAGPKGAIAIIQGDREPRLYEVPLNQVHMDSERPSDGPSTQTD